MVSLAPAPFDVRRSGVISDSLANVECGELVASWLGMPT